MSLPEKLYLCVDEDAKTLAIYDAQEIEWIVFRKGGLGDPVEWAQNTVERTCTALGIEEAWTSNGFQTGIDGALKLWLGEDAVQDGFLL